MRINKKPFVKVAANLGIVILLMACAAVGVFNSDESTLRLENGTIEVRDGDTAWRSANADSVFELTADLENIDPWVVAGKTLETNGETEIEEGLEVGDLVHVKGVILEDDTWLAASIEAAEEQVDPIIVLIGRVDSVDPWVVNEIPLNVNDETEIEGTITPGMLVRVEIILLEDGTWQVLRITPLDEVPELPNCTTVVATVIHVDGNQIRLLGWPTVTLSDDVVIEGSTPLEPNQTILVVVCPGDDGQIVIVQIIIIQLDVDEGETPSNGEKVLVCHKPAKKGGHTLSIAAPAVSAHLGHGDTLGPCP